MMTEIVLRVSGLPPAKGEAVSMFGQRHAHAGRIRRLLEAAQHEISSPTFRPFTGPIALDVTLTAPPDQEPWDATNYLGGIADALQQKGLSPLTEHLGALRDVYLYKNDRQIRQVSYRLMLGEPTSYQVRILELATAEHAIPPLRSPVAIETPWRRVVAVDWSGRRTGGAIWWAECDIASGDPVLRSGSREEALAELLRIVRQEPWTVIGLDFAFSFPAWFMDEQGARDAFSVWTVVAEKGEEWLQECPPPFWGRGKNLRRPNDVPLFRKTELEWPGSKSVFQLNFPGSVGVGSLRGMPYLAQMRAAGCTVWPFDPMRAPLVVEIFPRALTGPVIKSSLRGRSEYLRGLRLSSELLDQAVASEDAFDAVVAVIKMRQILRSMKEPFPILSDPFIREGRIWPPPDLLGDDG